MSIVLGFFCLTVVVMMPLDVELSVLIGFGGWGKPSYWSVMRRGTSVLPLRKSHPTSDSDADATTCFSILHSVWIRPFYDGGRFRAFSGSVGSELR